MKKPFPLLRTARLETRKLLASDADRFHQMMSNPNVMDPIPQPVFTRKESEIKLQELMEVDDESSVRILAIVLKGQSAMIGLAGYLVNDEGDEEIAYRLMEAYWGIGYGTEIAKGLINHAFDTSDIVKITADVNAENTKSVRILNRFFTPVRKFYNPTDQCTDIRYHLTKELWKKNN